jgi:glycosyltransferase involved in cell wall biosynthesis
VRTVLLISYAFPPQFDVSARRALKLCKYLPDAGWRPVVLTKDWSAPEVEEDRRAYALTSQPGALDEVPGLTVIRTPYRTRDNALRRLHARLGGAYAGGRPPTTTSRSGPAGGLLGLARRTLSLASPMFGDFPDPFRGWVSDAVDAGVATARNESIDAICSLCPPATAHVVASEIARRTGIPWVAQFDDLFSFHLEHERPAWRWYASRAHRRWLRGASRAGAITPAMSDYLRRTYGLDGGVVMVGFDPADAPPVERRPHDRLRLVYTGSVYLDDHRPEILFAALERVLASRPPDDRPIEVTFAGTRRDDELRARLARYPAAAQVCVFIDRLAPEAALRLQREADALLLFNYTAHATTNGTLSFPAKSFEYLSAGRPILALPRDPGGWGDDLLTSTGAGVAADSPAEAAAVIDGWLRARAAMGALPYGGSTEAIAAYSQPRQAAALASLLDQAVTNRRA